MILDNYKLGEENTMILSIIIPIYNSEKHLEKCINSVLNQTYHNIEIILVNDGSTDNSGIICEQYAQKYNNVFVIHKENGGLISAWATGLKKSKGECVGFIDSDDFLSDDYYEVLMRPFYKNNCDISMCGFSMEGEISKKVTPMKYLGTGLYSGNKLEEIKKNYFYYEIQNSRCLKVFKRKLILDNIKYIDSRVILGEDMTISVPCILEAKSIYIYQNYFGYHYQIYTKSMSHSLKPGQISNFYLLYKLIRFEFKDKGYPLDTVVVEFYKQMISVIGLIIFSRDTLVQKRKSLIKLRENKLLKNILVQSPNIKIRWWILGKLFEYKFYNLLILCGMIKSQILRNKNE